MRKIIFIVSITSVLLFNSSMGVCEALHGYAYPYTNWGWNFEDSTMVSYPDEWERFDFCIFHGSDWGIDVDLVYGKGGILVADSLFESVTIAPENDELYQNNVDRYYNLCYIVKTSNGCYAKIKILYPKPFDTTNVVEYVYQPDGSRILVSPVPVENISWGRIKSINH